MSGATQATLAQMLRQHDRDRYLTTLFAPSDKREALVALYAFNFEVAKTREIVHEPMLGQIRLQWWREAIDEIYRGGRPRRHDVAEPLALAIRRFDLTRYHFDRLIDARETDLAEEPPANLAVLERYAEDTASRLVFLALEILGARVPEAEQAGRHIGIAWALTGLIRALPVRVRARRPTLPSDLTIAAGLDQGTFMELKPSPALAAIVAQIAGVAADHLAVARGGRNAVPRHAMPALLPATLAAFHLRRLARVGHDPFNAALARPDALASWRLALAALTRNY